MLVLSDGEIHSLQKLAFNNLQEMNIGTALVLPKGMQYNYDT